MSARNHSPDLSDLSLRKFHECPGCKRLISLAEPRCLDCAERDADKLPGAAWRNKGIESASYTRDPGHHPKGN